ncbi:hypothetical protein [Serratia fonticola]
MEAKESYCYRILKTHSVIVDFDGEPHLTNVPGVVEGETFKQWKMRVLGPDATNVVVYYPDTPTPQTRMHNLKVTYSAKHVERMFRDFGRIKYGKKLLAVENSISETEARFSYVPRETLEILIDEKRGSLEPAVQEFFKEFLKPENGDFDIESLLGKLIDNYNKAVRKCNDLSTKN